jgi:hypothetical protein
VRNELITLLAYDALLLELDNEYQGVPETQLNLIHSKVLESYGLTLTSTKKEMDGMQKEIIKDIYKLRDSIIGSLEESK